MHLYCNLLTWLAAFADHENGQVNVELQTKIHERSE